MKITNAQNNSNFGAAARSRGKMLETVFDYNNRQRIAAALTLNKRNRGDMFGCILDETAEVIEWVDVSHLGLMSFQIFEPIVRANNANAVNLTPSFVWEAATNDSEQEAAADVAEAVQNHLFPRFITDVVREQSCELAQLSHNYFYYVYFDPNAESFSIRAPKHRKEKIKFGYQSYFCASCGEEILAEDAPMPETPMSLDAQNLYKNVDGFSTDAENPENGSMLLEQILNAQIPSMNRIPCPTCGGSMDLLGEVEEREEEVPDGYEDVPAGDLRFKLVSSFEMVVDERNARAGDPDGAHYLCYRHLVPEYEIKARYADMDLEVARQTETDWSLGNRWLRALETSGSIVRHGSYELSGIDSLLELKEWFYDKKAWTGEKWDELYELKNASGEVKFDVYPGETLEQACKRNFGVCYGIKIDIIGEQILDISPVRKQANWSGGLWMINATSFYGKAQESLLSLQDATNEFFNMMYEHASHASMPHTILDGMMFDGEDFQNRAGSYSYTKPGFNRTRPISDFIYRLDPSRMPPEVGNLFTFLIEGSREMSGATKTSTGGSDPNIKTLGGQQLTVQRALGLMAGYFKSNTLALRRFIENAVEQFRANMPPEAYLSIKTPDGEEMRDESIEAFRQASIGQTILCKAVQGTDIPTAFEEMQANYQIALQMGLFAPPELSGIPPEIQAKMLKLLRIDYDPNNYADQKRIAYARLKELKNLTKDAENAPEVMDESGNIAEDVIMTLDSQVPFLDRQDAHLLHIQILDAACVAASGAEVPNLLLIRLLQFRANRHYQAVAQMQAEQAATAGQVSKVQKTASGEDEPTETNEMSEEDRLVAEMLEREEERKHESEEKEKEREHQFMMANNQQKS